MKCEKIRSELMEAVLSGPEAITSELQEHLQGCQDCSRELATFQQTMSLMDEWQAPEPSPYFSSRLRARVREEAGTSRVGWMAWFRKPVLATAAAGLIALGAGLLESGHWTVGKHVTLAGNDGIVRTSTTDTAVGDLQYLDRNADLFTEFDALDGQSQTE